MVRVDSNQLQWLVLGDSTLVLQTGQEVSVHTDRRLNAVASELRQRIMKQLEDGGGYDNPAHRQALSELGAEICDAPGPDRFNQVSPPVGCGNLFMQLAGTHAGAHQAGHAAVPHPDGLRQRHQDRRAEPVAQA
jgi:hypothetical protein